MAPSQEDIKALLARIDERTMRCQEDLEKIKHVLLEGNGSPPLVVTVATMAIEIAALKEINENKQIPRHVWLGAFISFIAIVVSVVALMV